MCTRGKRDRRPMGKGHHCSICLVVVVVMVGPVDDQLSSNDSSDENCCDEDITVLRLVPPLGSFSTVSDTDLVDSSDCTLLAFCSKCVLAVSLVTCATSVVNPLARFSGTYMYISNKKNPKTFVAV